MRTYEPIYSPFHIGGSGTGQMNLPQNGGGNPGGQVVGQGPTNLQNPGQVTVPYNQVFSAYADTAHAAVDSGEVPSSLRDVVKNYFSALQP